MNNLCEHNQNSVPAAQMARAGHLASYAGWPSVFVWADITFNHELFILNRQKNVRTPRPGCRKRFSLNT
jgi:hypothetical protein